MPANKLAIVNRSTGVRKYLNEFEPAHVTYTDNGLSGDSVDPTELLYVGGEEVVFGTMAQRIILCSLETSRQKEKLLTLLLEATSKARVLPSLPIIRV